MNFNQYKHEYRELASKVNFSESLVEMQLMYAEKLFNNKVAIIYDPTHLSELLGISLEYLYGVANSPSFYYRKQSLKKKNGNIRHLNVPLPLLKETQKWIVDNILTSLETSIYTKAYKKGFSIKSNAKFHRNQSTVINIDISNYFGNIYFEDIYFIFRRLGYYNNVSVLLAKLCCLDDVLPQGSPSSPMLSNLATIKLDNRLSSFAKKINARYSRYSDDITFSGDLDPRRVVPAIKKIIEDEEFEVNNEKVKVRYFYQKQIVTGIIVNERMRVEKSELKKLRQEVYYIKKYGLENHFLNSANSNLYQNKDKYKEALLGRLGHASFISPHNDVIKGYFSYIKSLS